MSREIFKGETKLTNASELLGGIRQKVQEHGDLTDIEVWRATFPTIEFEEVDESFSGRKIDWEKRSFEERASYVCYMKDPQRAVILYQLDVAGRKINHRLDDSERIWWTWESGALKALDPKAQLSNDALQALSSYAFQSAGEWEEILEDLIDTSDISISDFKLFVKADGLNI